MTIIEMETKAEKRKRELKEIAEYNAQYDRILWDAYAAQGFTEQQIIALIRECDCR
jgi:hypothetical protein